MKQHSTEVEQGNKLIATEQDLELVMIFMDSVPAYWKNPITWNDLMFVVEKIEYLKNGNGNYEYSVDTGRDWCIIKTNDFNPKTLVAKSIHHDKKQSIWLAVVEFINWYNQNKKQIE